MDDDLHHRLAAALRQCPAHWVLTYDDEHTVPDVLYPDHRVLAYTLSNTANRAHIATEYAVLSHNMDVGESQPMIAGRETIWVRSDVRIILGA